MQTEGEPHAAPKVRAERIAGPVCAEIDTREADKHNGNRSDDKRRASGKRMTRQEGVSHEEEKAEVAHVEGNVPRGKTLAAGVTIDMNEIRRWARARDKKFEQWVDDCTATRAQE